MDDFVLLENSMLGNDKSLALKTVVGILRSLLILTLPEYLSRLLKTCGQMPSCPGDCILPEYSESSMLPAYLLKSSENFFLGLPSSVVRWVMSREKSVFHWYYSPAITTGSIQTIIQGGDNGMWKLISTSGSLLPHIQGTVDQGSTWKYHSPAYLYQIQPRHLSSTS